VQLSQRYLPRTEFDSYEDFLNNYTLNVPENFNFAYDVVDEYARLQPEKRAVVWCNEKGAERIITFGQLKTYSDKAAGVFSQLGIKKGNAVMLMLKRRYEYWICAVALCKIGALMIPATHLLTEKDIIYRCNAADVKMVLCVDEAPVLSAVETARPDCPSLELCAKLGEEKSGWLSYDKLWDEASEDWQKPTGDDLPKNEDPMLVYFTSGTTGNPKMALHDFTYPLGHIVTAKYWQQVVDDGLHLTIADTGWAKTSWGKIYGQWLCGSAVFVYDYDNFVPADILKVCSRYKLTTFCAPPTIYRFLINEDLSRYDLSSLRYGAVAGEPLNPEVFNQFKNATGIEIRDGFGQSETAILIGTFKWLSCRPGSMGKPNPLYAMELLGDDLRPVGVGEEGQIAIRVDQGPMPGIFDGYYKNPELTAEVWHDGYYFTGDKAWRDEDGYWWFIGRADDVIKSSGYRIGPFEVESVLIEHPAVLECAVTGVPHPVRGQVVKATVVLTKGYSGCDELVIELQEHVKHTTAPYKYPRIIEFVAELPKTISGKILRKQIRTRDQER
jgi:acetyl-CoA synthetase